MKPPFEIPDNLELEEDDEWVESLESFIESSDAGVLDFSDEIRLAQKFMWEIKNDRRLPEKYVMKLTCHNPVCISPEHMKVAF